MQLEIEQVLSWIEMRHKIVLNLCTIILLHGVKMRFSLYAYTCPAYSWEVP